MFTSNDKFHKSLIPLLLREDQKFIVGQELKEDLKTLLRFLILLKLMREKNIKMFRRLLNHHLLFNYGKSFQLSIKVIGTENFLKQKKR